MIPPKGPQEGEATYAGASKIVSPAIPVAGWEVVKKKPRATRCPRPDAVVVRASGKSYNDGDSKGRQTIVGPGKLSVRAMSDETKMLVLEIRDIDSIATEQDAERIRVRSLRRGYPESQSAVISLPYSLGKAVLHRGEVRIGWTICGIRERTGPQDASNAWNTGILH